MDYLYRLIPACVLNLDTYIDFEGQRRAENIFQVLFLAKKKSSEYSMRFVCLFEGHSDAERSGGLRRRLLHPAHLLHDVRHPRRLPALVPAGAAAVALLPSQSTQRKLSTLDFQAFIAMKTFSGSRLSNSRRRRRRKRPQRPVAALARPQRRLKRNPRPPPAKQEQLLERAAQRRIAERKRAREKKRRKVWPTNWNGRRLEENRQYFQQYSAEGRKKTGGISFVYVFFLLLLGLEINYTRYMVGGFQYFIQFRCNLI